MAKRFSSRKRQYNEESPAPLRRVKSKPTAMAQAPPPPPPSQAPPPSPPPPPPPPAAVVVTRIFEEVASLLAGFVDYMQHAVEQDRNSERQLATWTRALSAYASFLQARSTPLSLATLVRRDNVSLYALAQATAHAKQVFARLVAKLMSWCDSVQKRQAPVDETFLGEMQKSVSKKKRDMAAESRLRQEVSAMQRNREWPTVDQHQFRSQIMRGAIAHIAACKATATK